MSHTSKSESTSDPAPVFPEPVRDSTPTAGNVYAVLEAAGPLTYEQLVDQTGAGRTAVETAVDNLRKQGIIESRRDPNNPCRKVHGLPSSFDM